MLVNVGNIFPISPIFLFLYKNSGTDTQMPTTKNIEGRMVLAVNPVSKSNFTWDRIPSKIQQWIPRGYHTPRNM